MAFSMVQAAAARPALSARARPSARALSARAPAPAHRVATLRPLRAVGTDGEDDVMTTGWSASWSLKSYEDLAASISSQGIELKDDIAEAALGDVMSSPPITCTMETPISELVDSFRMISGMPVVNADGKLVGVVSKKDLAKSETGTVRDIMSRPPIAAKPGYKVSDGAAIMLKYAVHRLPIVDAEKRVIGIVTRTDISKAMSSDKEPVQA